MDTSEVRTVYFDGVLVSVTLDRFDGEVAVHVAVSGDIVGTSVIPVVPTALGSAVLPAPPLPPPPPIPESRAAADANIPLTPPPLTAEYVAAQIRVERFDALCETLTPQQRVLACDAYEVGVADRDAVECLRRCIRCERRHWEQIYGQDLSDHCAVVLRDASGSLPFTLAGREELARFISASPRGTVIGRVIIHARNLAPYLFGAGFLSIPPHRILDRAGNLVPYDAPVTSAAHRGTL
jgi:hypothetical protein